MSKKTVWYCDFCGSVDVEQKVWIAVNSSKEIDNQLWYEYRDEAGDDYFYCQNCKEECHITDEKPKKENK